MLVNEQDVLLEARVEMRFEAELTDDGVVVAVNVRVHAVHALEDLANKSRERLGERDTCTAVSVSDGFAGRLAVDLPILLGSTCSLSILA